MKIAVALFTYNRSYHTERVLDALRNNIILPEKLFVFQDGMKNETDQHEWEKVNELINNIDWCKNEVIVSSYNRGLAASIVSGINYVFKCYDAIIVLEDDCVPAISFIGFMHQCFEKYKNDSRVYSISGYSWPITVEKYEFDIYGCGRISSWGWGTWKERWRHYNQDIRVLKRMKEDRDKSLNLAVWGNDCEQMLLGNISGRNDSWAIYWGLYVIENNGICINPYESLIQNIGMDGTGQNCGISNRFWVKIQDEIVQDFKLPDQIEVRNDVKSAFANLYGSYTAINENEDMKEKVLIYGMGKFFTQYEKMLNERYYIEAIIDKGKNGWYAGKKIVDISDIKQYDYSKIIIMVANIQENISISKKLIKNNIDYREIVLGHNLFGRYHRKIDNISVTKEGELLLNIGSISIKVYSKDEFNNVYETLVENIYHYYINNRKRDIVLDIGMNIGDSILYFLNQSNVDKIYGYEPFRETFDRAKGNLKEYLCDSSKIEIFQIGIGDENIERVITFNSHMTCAQSTLEDARKIAHGMYKDMKLISEENEKAESVVVKKASEVFGPIVDKYSDHNIVLKMDCEGEEYNILRELLESGVLKKINFIMLEWHYRGKDILLKYLEKAGFSWWSNDKNESLGLIYAYKSNPTT